MDEKKEKQILEKKKTEENPKKEIAKKRLQKRESFVRGTSIPISTKYAKEICRFIKNKKIENAINDLEQVIKNKKSVPMRGEYGHKKDSKIGGKYPKKAAEQFIKLIKSLSANCIVNEINEPVIFIAMANKASRPLAKFGRWQRKRTHIKIIAKEKNKLNGAKIKRKK